ncbi:MAG: phosphoribosylglycinamide formyltransferase [Flavobacteriales bacterium]
MNDDRVRIAVLASGSGSNAEVLCRHFAQSRGVEVAVVGCNRPEEKAGVYARLRPFGIAVERVRAAELADGSAVNRFDALGVEGIVLAGFLVHVPESFIARYGGRILNVHPSLLPAFGGKGMFGMHVHEAVHAAGVRETGMTVHRVNGEYDRGEILFQARAAIEPGDTPETIAAKVLELEHRFYPEVVEREAATWHT